MRRTAFILALDSPGRNKSMLSRYIFHDLDSSLAKSTIYRLVQFLKQLFARYDSSTAYCFRFSTFHQLMGSMSFIGFLHLALEAGFWSGYTLSNCSIFALLNIQLLEPLLLLIKLAFVALCQFCGPFFVKLALRFLFRSRFRWRKRTRPFLFFLGGIFTEANAKYPRRILKAINNAKTIRTCCVEARTRYQLLVHRQVNWYMTRVWQNLSTIN